ncbi:MAG: glycosyltransferase family 4 protein [Dictyoglomaceae bacterium]|nr:glycosyltransferase family 4 protein [Dictyoglomaceae bacterium]
MNIAFFSDTYEPQKNGVVTAIKMQKKFLENYKNKVYLFIPYIPNSPSEENIFKLNSIVFPFQREHRVANPYSIKYDLLFRRLKVDIVHTHTPFSLGIFGWSQAKKRNIPLIHTFHTIFEEYAYYIWDHFPQIIKRKFIREKEAREVAIWISKSYCELCDLIIAPSTKVKKLLENYGVKKPIVILPNGLDLKDFKPLDKKVARKKRNLPLQGTILLFVGRLGKEKNITFLLKVMRWLKSNSNHPYYFLIVGDNPDKRIKEELIKEAEKYKIDDRVIFTGYLEYPQVIESYYSADIFIFSSLTETQGMVVGEALFSGLPVIALEDLAIGDFVKNGENGFLIPNNNHSIEEFGKKIILLTENKELYFTMSQNAKKSAENLSSHKLNKKLLETYERLISDYQKEEKYA